MNNKLAYVRNIMRVLFLYTFLFVGNNLTAQDHTFQIGLEFQAYPTGLIPGIAVDLPLTNKSLLHLRFGYNYIRHRDLGKHDDERGDGYGVSVGWKTIPFSRWDKFLMEFRSDIWFNKLDWRDDQPGGATFGYTEVTVLQPTVVAGYNLALGNNYVIVPTLAFGFEINVLTEGEEVGEGPILLIGFQLLRKIKKV